MENFNERFERLLFEKKVSKKDIAEAVGLSRTGISSWKDADRLPRADVAIKIAQMLNVPVDYLVLGETVELKQNNSEISVKIQELSDNQIKLVNALVDLLKAETLTPEGARIGKRWQMLPKDKQRIIDAMIADMEIAAKKENRKENKTNIT